MRHRATAPKKSWHQLFTRSSAVSPEPDTNSITLGNLNCQLEAKSSVDQRVLPSYPIDTQFNFQHPQSLSGYCSPNGLLNGNMVPNVVDESMFPHIKEPLGNTVGEDAELFEDPCYVPDAFSLLGPFSDQLDKLTLELGTGSVDNSAVEDPHVLKNVTAPTEVSKPAPIESPLSRLRASEGRQFSRTPKSQKSHASNMDDSGNVQGQGTWQMWGTPSAQDGLGLAGGPSSWFSPVVQRKSNQEKVSHPLGHNHIMSSIATESPHPSIFAPQKASVASLQNGGTFSPLGPSLNRNDPWVQNSPFQSPLPVDGESRFLPLDLIGNIAPNEALYSSPKSSAIVHPFEVPSANGWSK